VRLPPALRGLLIAGSLAGLALLVPGRTSGLALALLAAVLFAHVRALPEVLECRMRAAASAVMPVALRGPPPFVLAVGVVGFGHAVRLPELRGSGLRPLVRGLGSCDLLGGGTLVRVQVVAA
jgi:hypothetical protein